MTLFCIVLKVISSENCYAIAVVEGTILNLMFLDINLPVVPIEIWL